MKQLQKVYTWYYSSAQKYLQVISTVSQKSTSFI